VDLAAHAIHFVFVIFTGLVLGSFATALTWRVPRGIPWAAIGGRQKEFARSQCVSCQKTIPVQDLAPVFSWIALKGKCRHCGHAIGWQYPAIEIVTLLGCLGVYMVWGFTAPAFIIMAAVPLLVALLAIDLEHMILPNQLVALAAALAIILIVYQYLAYDASFGFGRQALQKLAGMAVFAGVAWLMGAAVGFLKKKEALGMGDVKFFAMAGLWLGLVYLPFFLIFSGLMGVISGIGYRYALKKEIFPFGPALILALYAGLLLQGLEIVPFLGVQ